MEVLADTGYLGLFLAAFLAATVLPLSSEVVLGILLAHEYHPVFAVGVATVGNVLGAVLNYYLGVLGSTIVFKKILRVSEQSLVKAENRFRQYGVFSLLFAWVPVIGDPLTIVAGMVKVRFSIFLVLVCIGKCLRYIFIAWAFLAAQ
ncbi:MAG: YqaA family protein [Pseudomonadota bacterium]